MIRRAVVLCALAIALRFLAILMPIFAHVGDAYSSLLFVTDPSSARLLWAGLPTLGMSQPIALADSVAFLEAVAMWVVNRRRVSSSTPRYLMACFTGMACPSTCKVGFSYIFFRVRTTASNFCGASCRPLLRIQTDAVSRAGFSKAVARLAGPRYAQDADVVSEGNAARHYQV